MSTKIYQAWRCPAKEFPLFVKTFHEHAFTKAVKMMDILAASVVQDKILEEMLPVYENWKKTYADFDSFVKDKYEIYKIRKCFQAALEASRSETRNFFCIDASFNAWFYKGKFYIIPYGERCILEDFQPPERAEEYAYWNNTDQPETLTRKQWVARGKTWDAVCLDDWNANRLVHEVINFKKDIGIIEISKMIFKNPNDAYAAAWLEWGKNGPERN